MPPSTVWNCLIVFALENMGLGMHPVTFIAAAMAAEGTRGWASAPCNEKGGDENFTGRTHRAHTNQAQRKRFERNENEIRFLGPGPALL